MRQTTPHSQSIEFYLLAIASFVETSAPLYQQSLQEVFVEDPNMIRWLNKVWLPHRVNQGRQLRLLVEKHWPDLEWSNAYFDYLRIAAHSSTQLSQCHTPASLALKHCVAERKKAMLAAATAGLNPLCKQATLLQAISTEALRGCSAFREAHQRHHDWEKIGITPVREHNYLGTLPKSSDIHAAFQAIQQHWYGQADLLDLDYGTFREQVELVLRTYWPIQEARRFMFVPYHQPMSEVEPAYTLLDSQYSLQVDTQPRAA